MKNDEYIPVKEFADRAGVSVQSVYQRLNTTLKDYSRLENGLKTINIKALEELYSIKVEQVFNQDFKEPLKSSEINDSENVFSNDFKGNFKEPFNEPLNNPLKSDEIKEKDNSEVLFLRNQVEQLQMELIKERQHSKELAGRVADLAEKVVVLTDQAQKLQLAQMNPQISEQNKEVEKESEPETIKKPWWKSLFS